MVSVCYAYTEETMKLVDNDWPDNSLDELIPSRKDDSIMFTIYDGVHKITDNPVSYNKLLTMFDGVDIDWQRINTLPLGESVNYDQYTIVREV